MLLIKKYGNRRLYDTDASRYITLEELGDRVRKGADVRVVDAGSNEDLTQATLTQLIMEHRGAARLLPVPLLHQLIRLGDDALGEFFTRYVSGALEMYNQARQVNPFAGFNPFFNPMQAMQPMPAAPSPQRNSEMDELRREVEEMKKALRKRRK